MGLDPQQLCQEGSMIAESVGLRSKLSICPSSVFLASSSMLPTHPFRRPLIHGHVLYGCAGPQGEERQGKAHRGPAAVPQGERSTVSPLQLLRWVDWRRPQGG